MNSISRRGLLTTSAAVLAGAATTTSAKAAKSAESRLVYISGYTGDAKGIYLFQMDGSEGSLTLISITEHVSNPSFLAIDPGKKFLYCVNENDPGTVSSFSINQANGLLTPLNSQPSGGAAPAHLSVHPSGKYVLVANYTGSTIEVIPIKSDGSLGTPTDLVTHTDSLGPNTVRQDKPHPHMILTDPSGRYILVNDLGQDRTYVYKLDLAEGKLSLVRYVESQPGSGPRHFAFHPNGRYFYSLNELASTINFYLWDSGPGTLTFVQNISTLPPNFTGISTAGEIKVNPSGDFVYSSNRGFDSIAAFSVNENNGKLSRDSQPWTWTRGETPRFFTPDPSATFLYAANQNSDNVTIFDLVDDGAKINFTGRFVSAGNPSCILFL